MVFIWVSTAAKKNRELRKLVFLDKPEKCVRCHTMTTMAVNHSKGSFAVCSQACLEKETDNIEQGLLDADLNWSHPEEADEDVEDGYLEPSDRGAQECGVCGERIAEIKDKFSPDKFCWYCFQGKDSL